VNGEGRDQVAEPDALALHPCEPKTSSASRDQVIFADPAVGESLSPDAVPLKIDRFGPRAAWGTLEPPPVRDKNGLSRLRTVTMKIPGKPNGQWCTSPAHLIPVPPRSRQPGLS
jgi:hypothetical protein